MARISRRSGSKSSPRESAARGSSVGPRVSGTRPAPASERNLLEDCAGIDEMGRRRPVSRRLNLNAEDLTDETGLDVGRQRNVPKTIRNASLPDLDVDDLDRGLPKLPGESGARAANASAASRSALAANALEPYDSETTQPAPHHRQNNAGAALETRAERVETLPVSLPPADSGIMRARMGASAVLGAVDYNDDMKGTTVEEARRRDAQASAAAKPPRRGRRGRKGRRATGANNAARPQGKSTMAKPSARAGTASRRAPKESRTSARTSRRSKASRTGKTEGNATMVLGIVGGVVLLLIVIGIVAFATSNTNPGAGKKSNVEQHAEDSPQYWEAKGDALVRSGGDRNEAREYLNRAAELYEKQGDQARSDELARKAYGLLKDGHVDVRGH